VNTIRWLILTSVLWVLLNRLLAWVLDRIALSRTGPSTWKSLDLIYNEVTKKLEQQSDNWGRLDDRLRWILGVIGIVFAAALTLRAATPSGGTPVPVPWWVAVPAVLAVVVFLVAAGIVAWAYQIADFHRPPHPVSLRDQYLLSDPRQSKLDIVDSINAAYNKNALVIEKKADAFTKAFWVSALATLLLGLAVVGQVLSNTDLSGPAAFIGANASAAWTRALEFWSQVQRGQDGGEQARQTPEPTPAAAEP
jgi:hypothetical protein